MSEHPESRTPLSDDEIDTYAKFLGWKDDNASSRDMQVMAREIRRHRAAKRADVEQVREVVRAAVLDVLPEGQEDADAIADRVAGQLANPTPTAAPLAPDEVKMLRHRIRDWRVNYETSVRLVERLLDGATAASVLSAEDRQSLELLKGIVIGHRASLDMARADPIVAGHVANCERAVTVLDRLLGAKP